MPVCTNPGARVRLQLVAIALCAAAPARSAETRSEAELFRLANGMRWIAAPMESPGEVTVVFYVATGASHESTEARGAVATLVELWRLGAPEVLAAQGVAPAAFANPDFALARATWPTGRLDKAVSFAAAHWLEPDTTRFAEARAQAIGSRERALQGRLRLYWEMCRAAYAVHPYGRPYYGEPGVLERLDPSAFRGHLAAHLVPANLVVVVTGEFDLAALRRAAEREFGKRPALAAPRAIRGAEPPQRGEKRVVLADAPASGLAIGFHKSAGAAPDISAWGVLTEAWRRRLERRTAGQAKLIRRFDAEQGPAMKYPNLVFALWEVDPAAELGALETAAVEEWSRLGLEPLPPPELEEVKARLSGESRKPDARTHGQHLADWLAMTGDFRPAFDQTARLRAVTARQVLALARDTFRPSNRTVVTSVAARPEAGPAVEGKIARDGFDLWYRIYGSGRPVLLLSGGPGLDCDYLEPVARELATRQQAILVELRGTGRSRPPVVSAETVSVEAYLADLEALRAHLKVDRWTVLGHSAGGSLGLFYAAAHPASVAALVLVSAGHVVHEPDNAVTDNVLMRLSPREQQQVREGGQSTAGTPEERMAARMKLMLPGYFFDREKAAGMAAAMKESSVHFDTMQLLMRALLYPGMDLRPALKDFARPVLVIAGRQDPVDPKVQYETHLALRSSTLELVPRCGHFPWIEQPDRFYAAVDRLLAGAVHAPER